MGDMRSSYPGAVGHHRVYKITRNWLPFDCRIWIVVSLMSQKYRWSMTVSFRTCGPQVLLRRCYLMSIKLIGLFSICRINLWCARLLSPPRCALSLMLQQEDTMEFLSMTAWKRAKICWAISLRLCCASGDGVLVSLSDVEKAFLQISISEGDRDVHRFLWNLGGQILVESGWGDKAHEIPTCSIWELCKSVSVECHHPAPFG